MKASMQMSVTPTIPPTTPPTIAPTLEDFRSGDDSGPCDSSLVGSGGAADLGNEDAVCVCNVAVFVAFDHFVVNVVDDDVGLPDDLGDKY